jgi:1,4-alpha-glucan branching enzyme
MYNHWRDDLDAAVTALESIRFTYLPRIISGEIHTIEKSDHHVLLLLDTKSGIDYLRENAEGVQGIAARIQWGRAWNTFTIRAKRHTGAETELAKRMRAIEEGYFYPAFTLQAYFNNREENKLLSIGAIRTKDLYRFVQEHPEKVHANKSDNAFLFVRWVDIGEAVKSIEAGRSE